MKHFPQSSNYDRRSAVNCYLISVISCAAAFVFDQSLRPWIGSEPFFPPFSLAILFSAWYGGLGPGLVVTALASVLNAYFFAPPLRAW